METVKLRYMKYANREGGQIIRCPNSPDEHAHLPCYRCGSAASLHAMVEKKSAPECPATRRNSGGFYDDRIAICQACYDAITPFVALESLMP